MIENLVKALTMPYEATVAAVQDVSLGQIKMLNEKISALEKRLEMEKQVNEILKNRIELLYEKIEKGGGE